MKIMFAVMIYFLLGLIGRKVFGYKGILETVLWPLGIACIIYLKMIEEEK